MQHTIETKKDETTKRSSPMIIHIKYGVAVAALVAVVILSNTVFAQQTPPTSPATPSTFLNISNTAQQKAGWLGLGALTSSALPTSVVDVTGTFIADVLGVLGTTWITEKLHIGGTTATSLPQPTDPTLVVENSRIRSLVLSGSGERTICADANGRLILCAATPTSPNAPVDGTCGEAAMLIQGGLGLTEYDNFEYSALGNPYLCRTGTPVIPVMITGGQLNAGTGNYNPIRVRWICQGINGGQSAYCGTLGKCPALPGQPGCFLAGTMVTLADGTKKPIEEVNLEDKVKTQNGLSNNVVDTMKLPYEGWVYGINGSDPFVTSSHPMLTTAGWKSFDPEATKITNPDLVIAGKLKKGDVLIKEGGTTEEIRSLTREWMKTTVYNLTVTGDRVFYADNFAVHNKQTVNNCVPPAPEPNPGPAPSTGPLCAGTATAPACNASAVKGAISVTPYTYTASCQAYLTTKYTYPVGYGCTITYSQKNSSGNNIVSQVNCTDYCME